MEGSVEHKPNRHRGRPNLLSRGPRYVREKLQGKIFLVPSFITVGGIFCGFLGVMCAIRGGADNFVYATKCIFVAMVLDGLDGRVARRLNATSNFGREFDSLSDVIAFGVAPAVLVYCWGLRNVADEFGILVGFIFVVCSATRLARFNVISVSEEPKSSNFVGLPTPGSAAAVTSLVYFWPQPIVNEFAVGFISAYMLCVAFLMVSTLPFGSPKKVKITQENQKLFVVAIAAFVALTWKYSQFVYIIVSTTYAMSGPLLYVAQQRKRQIAAPTSPHTM